MTTIFYILIAFCLFFEVLNLAACKKVFAAVEKYKDKNDRGIGKSGKQPRAVMDDVGALAVHDIRGAGDLRPGEVAQAISLLPAGGAALSSAAETASYAAYSMDDVNSALAAPKMAVPAGGSADAMSDRDAGGTGALSAEAAQTSTKLIYSSRLS